MIVVKDSLTYEDFWTCELLRPLCCWVSMILFFFSMSLRSSWIFSSFLLSSLSSDFTALFAPQSLCSRDWTLSIFSNLGGDFDFCLFVEELSCVLLLILLVLWWFLEKLLGLKVDSLTLIFSLSLDWLRVPLAVDGNLDLDWLTLLPRLNESWCCGSNGLTLFFLDYSPGEKSKILW